MEGKYLHFKQNSRDEFWRNWLTLRITEQSDGWLLNLKVNKPTQITLNAEQYLRKYANLDIIISSLNMYHSLLYANLFP